MKSSTFVSAGIALSFLYGCGVELNPPEPEEEAQQEQLVLPDGYMQQGDHVIFDGDIIVSSVEQWKKDAQGPRQQALVGRARSGDRWPDRIVHYELDSTIPQQERIFAAMAQWEDALDFEFVPATSGRRMKIQAGHGCSSGVGRPNSFSTKTITVASGGEVVGTAISKSKNDVYFWYKATTVVEGVAGPESVVVGTVSRGTSLDSAKHQGGQDVDYPPGKGPDDVVDMVFIGNERLVTYFTDGTYTEGTSTDLDQFRGPRAYTSPSKIKAIVGIAFDEATDRYSTLYTNGRRSLGTKTNLGSVVSSGRFSIPSDLKRVDIKGIARNSSGKLYSWFENVRLIGHSSDLNFDNQRKPYIYPSGFCDATTMVHEFGHTIGLGHTQQRCDRDQHVDIHLENLNPIPQVPLSNLLPTHCSSGWDDFGDYDFGSIMHYQGEAISLSGASTITRKVNLGALINDSKGMAIDATGRVYSLFLLGQVDRFGNRLKRFTIGSSRHLDSTQAMRAFNRDLSSVQAFAIDPRTNEAVYWRSNLRFSKGLLQDNNGDVVALSDDGTRTRYTLPAGKLPTDIVDAVINSAGNVLMYFKDGTFSLGTVENPGKFYPLTYSMPSNLSPRDIIGMGVTQSGAIYTWYKNGTRSIGVGVELDRYSNPRSVRSHGTFIPRNESGLTEQDIENVELMYGPN